MTGQEHYAEAERLADRANHYTYGDGADPITGHALAAEAQVHATLALVAAQIEANAAVGVCPHGSTGICMYCVISNDLMRPAS